MTESRDSAWLLTLFSDLVSWLGAWKVPWMVIGGVAASLLGRPRLTRDVDVLMALGEPRRPRLLRAGAEFGFLPRQAEVPEFAPQTGVLLLRHEKSGLEVNLVFASLAFENEALSRATRVDLGTVQLPLPTPEDLIIMKALSRRPQDREDVKGILAAHPQLHLWLMLSWVHRLAAALDKPELLTDLEALLNQRRLRPETGR